MNKITALFFFVFLTQTMALAAPIRNNIPVTPDVEKTPGDFCSKQDKDFLEYRYAEQMEYCERKVSQWQKNRVYNMYNIPEKCRHRYTVDHLVPLAVGGNNSDENLWPEHVLVKKTRQELEQDLYEKVRRGEMLSKDAVEIIMYEKLELQLDLSHVEGCG